MAFWRVEVETSPDFEGQLYEQESEDDVEDESNNSESGDSDDENDEPVNRSRSPTPVAPPFSSLSSQRHESRERSRSPINFHQPSASRTPWGNVILKEKDVPLDIPDAQLSAEDGGDSVFLYEHSIFGSGVSVNVSERGTSERRGVQSVRGRGRGVRGRKNLKNGQWEVGYPLNEIWTTDADVPPELVSLAEDVVRKRRQNKRSNRGKVSESEEDVKEEFLDASDGRDSLLDVRFQWSPMDSFSGEEETFRPKRTGSTRRYSSAYDAFRSYWDDDILQLIVAETNQYATNIPSAPFQAEWYPTNVHEILCLFSFWMMLGIIRMPSILSCFSVDPLLKTEVFRRIFTRKRYNQLTRALNFVDSDSACNDTDPSKTGAARNLDRLHHLRPIISHLNSKFQSNYILNKDICIDESLTLWKGRLDFKQCNRTKDSKLGIKTFELCESTTGYLWSFIVDTGENATLDLDQSPFVRKSTAVVKKLMGPLLNKGYRLFMNDQYNSPLLARFLKLNGTDCVGTLRSSCRDVPALIYHAPLKQGELIARHSGDVMVLSWQDNKRVTMISTCHGSTSALSTVSSKPSSRVVPYKPQVVLDYNKFMGGVDLKDQMLEPYLLEQKRCSKWYMKLFRRLLNVSILNARTLLQSSTQEKHDHLAFRLQLVDSILTNHLQHCPVIRRFTVSASKSTHQQPGRFLDHSHWPVRLEQTASSLANCRSFRKRCIVCLREGRQSNKTAFCCEACGVPLCIDNCFKAYHTTYVLYS